MAPLRIPLLLSSKTIVTLLYIFDKYLCQKYKGYCQNHWKYDINNTTFLTSYSTSPSKKWLGKIDMQDAVTQAPETK